MFEAFGVINYYSFVTASIAIVLMPGPNSLYVLSVSAKHGIRFGYCGAVGIFLGDAILMLITALGAHSIINAYPWIFQSIKYVGVIYLAYLGINILYQTYKNIQKHHINQIKIISSTNTENTIDNQTGGVRKISELHVICKALYISLINPKAIVFFLAFFMQFIQPNAPLWQPFLLLGVTLQIISFGYLTLIIFAGKHLSHFFKKYAWLNYTSNAMVGLVFVYFAYLLCINS